LKISYINALANICEKVGADVEQVAEGMGLDKFPVPISTPGFDNAPYTTCSHWITKDLENGIQNIGNYRGQMKGRRRVGLFPSAASSVIKKFWCRNGLHHNKERAPLESGM